jgi:hypothetical protein
LALDTGAAASIGSEGCSALAGKGVSIRIIELANKRVEIRIWRTLNKWP